MGYWKSKVLPKIKKVFEKNGSKRAAAEASKSFDDSKEEINKQLEEKRAELKPKVLEIYGASSTEIKLCNAEFPGCKVVAEVVSKFGPTHVPGPVIFILEKVSTFILVEEAGSADKAIGAKEEEVVAVEEEEEKAEGVAEKIEEKKDEDSSTSAFKSTATVAEEVAAPTVESEKANT
ncbi:Plasma membrane-associated cation-binding protein 1 [Apostasia shenzhenica]|uniref:Plasma membrane-associated cation-binding protein 1 n=1 Tax=Apostasia shenzhenica TaxID=1088818 RepID=A0A2I0AFV1_9ASPA|nr:Plasma membrane-associated cation-binding protein 1 [Apostasia shenzhenica]